MATNNAPDDPPDGRDCPESHTDWIDYKANYCPYCGEELDNDRIR